MTKKAKIILIISALVLVLAIAGIVVYNYVIGTDNGDGAVKPEDEIPGGQGSGTVEDGIEKIRVIFNSNGGTTVQDQLIDKDKTITEPTVTKPNLSFGGWYTAEDEQFDFTIPVKESLTLNAKWNAKVSFPEIGKEYVVAENSCIPEIIEGLADVENLDFYGWKDQNENCFNLEAPITENKTVSSVWGTKKNLLKFTLNDLSDGYIVSCAENGEINGELIIPNCYENKPVTEISGDYNADLLSFADANISQILIPQTVTKIGVSAFSGCESLTEVDLPDSIISIGNDAFVSCINLRNVTFPKKLELLGASAFNSTNIKDINIPSAKKIGDRCFANVPFETIILPSNLETIGDFVFSEAAKTGDYTNYSTSCEEITIPKSVVTIGQGAFWGSGFKSIIFEKESIIKELDGKTNSSLSRIFYDCTFLESIEIPASVELIGKENFVGCNNLKSITFESNSRLREIKDYAFVGCPNLEGTFIFPSSVETIGSTLFSPGGESKIDKIIFEDNSQLSCPVANSFNVIAPKLTYFSFGNNSKVTTLSQEANNRFNFSGSIIKEFNFGENSKIISIPNSAFENCANLKSITLPNVLRTIGAGAFQQSGLTSVRIPDSVEIISDGAFNCCVGLSNVIMGSNVKTIGAGAFQQSGLTSVRIPDSVETIGVAAFNSCEKLTSLTLSNSVETIGGGAFANSGLTSVTIPGSVKIIDAGTFSACKDLESVIIESGVEKIGRVAFGGCAKLALVYIPATVIEIADESFNVSSNIVINCEASKKPEKWADNFCSSTATVTINYNVVCTNEEQD